MSVVTIIESGGSGEPNRARHGSFLQMLWRMTDAADASIGFDIVSLIGDERCLRPAALQAILITGLCRPP